MITEEREIPSGWPLGLGNMNMRLRVLERLPSFAGEPRSLHITSASFSSSSSSNLDTEINQSTSSFFQDHSVSLGRLIGFKRRERGGFYWTNSVRFEDSNRIPTGDANSDVSGHGVDMSQGICIPLLLGALVKVSLRKSKSRK